MLEVAYTAYSGKVQAATLDLFLGGNTYESIRKRKEVG